MSILAGLIFSPVILIVMVAMKVSSPGQLLFRQTRLGLHGVPFQINKFRKFPADWGDTGPGVTLPLDSRMTGVGRFLERTKLDDLPHLWYILVGEMSFVGPRPESMRFRDLFTGEFARILNYTPGIFGPNQAKYRNESTMYPADEDPDQYYRTVLFPDKAKADLRYFSRANLFSDLWCIVTGFFALVFSVVVWRKSLKASLVLLAWDVLAVCMAWIVTHWLKYSLVATKAITAPSVTLFKAGFFVIPLVLILVFSAARVYRHPVRYFSEKDFYRLFGSACVAWIVAAIVFGLALNSTSSLLLSVACVVSIFIMAIPRVTYRQWHDRSDVELLPYGQTEINVLVYGVNRRSIQLCNLITNGFDRAKVIGILSDDIEQVRREIHGFQVVGPISELDVLHARYDIHLVWISGNTELAAEKAIRGFCGRHKIELCVLSDTPGFDLIDGRPTVLPTKGQTEVKFKTRTSASEREKEAAV